MDFKLSSCNSQVSAKLVVVAAFFQSRNYKKPNAHLVSITELFAPRLNLREVAEFKGILSTTHVASTRSDMLKVILTKQEELGPIRPRWPTRHANVSYLLSGCASFLSVESHRSGHVICLRVTFSYDALAKQVPLLAVC